MLKCCVNIPDVTFWAVAIERKWAHKEKEKKISDPDGIGWDSNPQRPEQITVVLPTELQGQMGAGPSDYSLHVTLVNCII